MVFHMRFAICNELFGDWPLERALAFSAECGYAGVELAPFTLAGSVTEIDARRRAEIRRAIEEASLEMIGLHWLLAGTKDFYLTSPERSVREATADYLAELARFSQSWVAI